MVRKKKCGKNKPNCKRPLAEIYRDSPKKAMAKARKIYKNIKKRSNKALREANKILKNI